jgi:hypothetical protein
MRCVQPGKAHASVNGMERRAWIRRWVAAGWLAVAMTAGAVDFPLDGHSLRLTDGPRPQKRRNVVSLRDADVALDALDPTVTGAVLRIGRIGGPASVLDLPATGWKPAKAGFRFKARGGAVTAARLVDGRAIKVSARGGDAYALGGIPQNAVGVTVDVGATRFCAVFGGTVARDDGKKFRATRALAPATCPALATTTTTIVGGTTSTSFSSTTTTTSSTTTTTSSCYPADAAGNDSATGCPCLGTFDCCGICSATKFCTGSNRAPFGGDPGAALSCYSQTCYPADAAGNDNVTGCPCIGTFDCCGICSANHFCTGANRPPSGPDPGAAPSCF